MAFPIKIKKLNPAARIPTKSYENAAAFDFYLYDGIVLEPNKIVKIPLGIAAEIPTGYCLYFIGRSGVSSNGLVKLGGLVDSDYRGELMAIIWNTNDNQVGLEAGFKIVQGVLLPVIDATISLVEDLSDTERGTKGFGSTN